jgi:hypothetical protein
VGGVFFLRQTSSRSCGGKPGFVLVSLKQAHNTNRCVVDGQKSNPSGIDSFGTTIWKMWKTSGKYTYIYYYIHIRTPTKSQRE